MNDPDRLHWDEIVAEGRAAREAADGAQWALGALAMRVEITYGERDLQRFAEQIGIEPDTLDWYRRVARRFPIRIGNLPWWVYRVLSQFPEPERDAALARAVDEHWTVAKARAELKRTQDAQEPPQERPHQGAKKNLGMKASGDPVIKRFSLIASAFDGLREDEEREDTEPEQMARAIQFDLERRRAVERAVEQATRFVDKWSNILMMDVEPPAAEWASG